MLILKIIKCIILLLIFYDISVYGTVLLNSSYDVSRELFAEINASFIIYWQDKYPDDKLIIRQSHAGSTRQAMAILQGLRADVVTYNQVTDVNILYDRGQLIPKDWQNRFPNNSSPFYSMMAFIVRQGNPKKIYNWNDLSKEGVQIVFPNPKTSGNGRYVYLAAWHAFFQNSNSNVEQTRIWMKNFLKNVIAFDTGGRAATSTFIDRHQGDVLISFEAEARLIQNQYNSKSYEIIIPQSNILVEFPVTWIDRNVLKNDTQNVAQTYLAYLYTPEAQEIITKFGYRVDNMINNTKTVHNNRVIDNVVTLFKVEEQYGDWNTIMYIHFRRGGEFDQLLSAGHH